MSFTKKKDYYAHERSDLLKFLPSGAKLKKVLDVGCGSGITGQYLKRQMHVKQVVGIELNEEMAQQAKAVFDQVIIGDIQHLDLPFAPGYFDAIICADVLEHLYDPWSALARLKGYLSNEGYLLVSVPNVQHWSMILKLLAGRWDYKDEGILDCTHLRFFTRKSVRELIQRAGFQIEKMHGAMGGETRFLNLITLGMLSSFLSFHYFVLARKSNRNSCKLSVFYD